MATIYLIRHQSVGFVHEFPFAAPPTEAQVSAVLRICAQRLSAKEHAKTGEYWHKVVPVDVLDADDLPEVRPVAMGLSVANQASAEEFSVSGKAHVSNPKGR